MSNRLDYLYKFGLNAVNGNMTVITGSSGSGKTLTIINIIDCLNSNQNAIIMCGDESISSFLSKIDFLNKKEKDVEFKILKNYNNILEFQNKQGSNIKFISSTNFRDCLTLAKQEDGSFNFNNYTFIIDGFDFIDQDSMINWHRFRVFKRVLLKEKISIKKNIIKIPVASKYYSEKRENIQKVIYSLREFTHLNNTQIILIKNSYRQELEQYAVQNYSLPSAISYGVDNIVATEKTRENQQTNENYSYKIKILKSRY